MQTVKLTIEAWAKFGSQDDFIANIDIFPLSINPLANNEKQTVNESGENGIGFLSFSYKTQFTDSIYTPICTCNCTSSIPAHNSNDQPVTLSPACINFRPTESEPYQQMSSSSTDNSDQQMHDFCSSPWGWIAVTILFMLLTILFFIISVAVICINRNMTRGPKENKKGLASENSGE